MYSEDTKTLKFNQYQKPDKAQLIYYNGSKNNPENHLQ